MTAAPAFFGTATSALYAASPSAGTLTVFAVDPKTGGFEQTGCFAATARAGCTTIPALAGATDIAVEDGSPYVAVAARDADAVVLFERRDRTLVPLPGAAGCAATAMAGCLPARALDEPVAVALADRRIFVAARGSDAVSAFSLTSGVLRQDGCIEQGDGAADGCSPGRALDAPEDLQADGDDDSGFHAADRLAVASSRSNGVALLQTGGAAPTQAAGTAGCVTQGGTEGCAPQAGLLGAARLARAKGIYVAAPGSGTLTAIAGGSVPAPTAALASPPKPRAIPADAGSYAGSHLYAGGNGIAPFRRDSASGALTGLAGPAFAPAGAVAGLAVSGDDDSLAVYAAVPSTGAVVAFARNIPPRCGPGWFRPEPIKVTARAASVPTGCFDANGDPLSYTVTSPPKLGHIIGFDGGAALYRGPMINRAKRVDSFDIRASDGGETAFGHIEVELGYITDEEGKVLGRPSFRILDRRARMDRRGRIRLRVRCTTKSGSACRARLALRRARGVARKSVTLPSRRTQRLSLPLAKRTRRAVRRARKGVLVTVSATARDSAGRTSTAKRRVRVRARR